MVRNTEDSVDTIIKQWQKELPELASEKMALIGRLKRCAALIQPKLDSVFNEYGLGSGSFDVLATLRRSGSPYCLSPTELFASLMVTSGTMTVRLQKLESQGLIKRVPNPNDARSTLVQLTEKGAQLIEKAVFEHVENESRLLDGLSDETQQQLNQNLAELMYLLENKNNR